MTTPLESSIVRIRTANGEVVGTGFLVAERHVLTCAHVVSQALGLLDDTPEKPQGEVHLDFPLVAAGHVLTARVMEWKPPQRDRRGDIAGLELTGDPPAGARPVRLVTTDDLWAHTFRAFGFPSRYDDGVWASGVLRGRTGADWVQIEDVKATGYFVAPGFSGAPVWDEQLEGVAGMAVAAEERPDVKAAFIIPVDVLLATWPALHRQTSVEHVRPPFKGLQFFKEADADLFFGREELTAELVRHLREHRFLAVIGASGSGKSSLVRAGLVPALKRGEPLADAGGTRPPDGSIHWPMHVITPTAHPLEALAASLTRDTKSTTMTATLMDDLARDPRSLRLYVRKTLSREGGDRVLLLVDQFEELFTLCLDAKERQAFVDNLLTAVAPDTGGPTSVVIVLRADFYQECAQYANLREALEKQQIYIGLMEPEELRQAIEEPARRNRWEFEPGLVDLILREAQEGPGPLPLLSHALLETWKNREGHVLTLKGYIQAGGVRGAIAKTAETVFEQRLTPEQQIIARNIFLRLVELSEVAEATRRRAALAELIPRPEDEPAVEAVLKTLADARLITTGKDTVEVAHEALISEWPTLQEWLAKNREDLMIHRRLTVTANEWAHLSRDPGLLYRGVRLAEAERWEAKQRAEMNAIARSEMNAIEREFLDAGRAAQRGERLRAYLLWTLIGVVVFAVLGIGFWRLVYIPYEEKRAQAQATLEARRTQAQALKDNPLIEMPGGEIIFGDDMLDPQFLDYGERTAERMPVKTFWIQKHEVTNAEYTLCVNMGACEQPRDTTYFANPELADHPIVYVTALQADMYCDWLGLRLPTEVEWERAARGLAPSRKWPWGKDDPSPTTAHLSFPGLDREGSAPVGSYPDGATPEGVLDLVGNVKEWTSTTIVEKECPECPRGYQYLTDQWKRGQEDVMLVQRGGAWNVNSMTRVTQIAWELAKHNVYNEFTGFRCARSTPPPLDP